MLLRSKQCCFANNRQLRLKSCMKRLCFLGLVLLVPWDCTVSIPCLFSFWYNSGNAFRRYGSNDVALSRNGRWSFLCQVHLWKWEPRATSGQISISINDSMLLPLFSHFRRCYHVENEKHCRNNNCGRRTNIFHYHSKPIGSKRVYRGPQPKDCGKYD